MKMNGKRIGGEQVPYGSAEEGWTYRGVGLAVKNACDRFLEARGLKLTRQEINRRQLKLARALQTQRRARGHGSGVRP